MVVMMVMMVVMVVMSDRWRCSQGSRSGPPGTRRGTDRPPQGQLTDHTVQHRSQSTPGMGGWGGLE